MSVKEETVGMDLLKEIANVSGKSGLYRILKPSRSGVIVETLNEKKEKIMIGPTARVSVLKDVSVFTDGEQDSVPLAEVFLKIREQHGELVELDTKAASDKDLTEFLNEILPDFDRARVYVSDIKKIILWYNLLSQYAPAAFAKAESAAEATEAEVPTEAEEVPAEPAKAPAKKSKKA